MQTLLRDVHYGFRMFRKHYVMAAVVVLTLALGLGVNTAVFSTVQAVLLRPLPFRDDSRLVRIYDAGLRPGEAPSLVGVSRRNLHAVREQSRLLAGVAAQRYRDLTLLGEEGPERIVGIGVSDDWLSTLGIEPVLGRDFLSEESRQGSDATVALISHATWQNRLGGDPQVLDRTVVLDGREHQVIGVLPPGFNYPYQSEVWFPMTFDRSDGRSHNLNVQARLGPGVDLREFQAELDLVAERLAAEFPDTNTGYGLQAVPTREVLLGDQHTVILALFAAVVFLLLIVGVNVANLLLTSSISRREEFAMRAALGGGRWRQVRQLMTEGLLLAGFGGVLGVLLAVWGAELLGALIPPAMTYVLKQIRIDAAVLVYALLLTALTGIAFSLAPALNLTRSSLAEVMKSGGRSRGASSRSHKLLSGLVVVEIALALTLLSGSAVMIRTFRNLQEAKLGFSTNHLLTMTAVLPENRYPTGERRVGFVREVLERIAALPGVSAAGMTHCFPFPPENNLAVMVVRGRPVVPNEQLIVNHRLVSPGLLEAMEIPLLLGRGITRQDSSSEQPIAVISQSLAERYWPGEDPLGKQVAWVTGGVRQPWMTVVGVAGNVKEPDEIEDTWYLPYAHHAAAPVAEQVIFTIRSTVPPLSLVQSLRESVWEVDRILPVFDIATAEQQYADTISEQRLGTMAFTIFSVLGVLLAVIGVYGMMSYVVGQRTHEFGIRIALGANARGMLGLVTKQASLLLLAGVVLGVIGGVLLSRYLYGLLPEAVRLGAASFAAVTVLLALATLAASVLPARRATRVDPLSVLRVE